MKFAGTGRLAALLVSLLPLLAGGDARARDTYKGSLDPAIPRHQAVLDTLRRLEENPADAGLKNDLGCLIAQEGFWRDALREFGEAGDLDKKASSPYFNAGLVHAMRSEWMGARSSFRKAVDRDPGNWPAWWMLGFAEEQLGNNSAAVDAYQTSIRVDNSLFDVSVNPYAAWTNLKLRVYIASYDTRRVRVTLAGAEQLSDAERVTSFFQKSKRLKAQAAAPEPVPTIEAKSGPVIVAAPTGATHPSASPQGPTWNPQPGPSRRRDESRRTIDPAWVPPVPPSTPAPTPAPAGGAPAGVPPVDAAAPGTPVPGIAVPGYGGPGIGGQVPPAPTPAPQ